MGHKEDIKYFTHPKESVFAGMQIRENPDDAFENAIKRGMKHPEDWMYMYSENGRDYFKRNECVFEDMKLDIESFLENTEILTMGEQTVLRLKYVDGFTDEQIGEELGYDRSTISRKIDKIVKKCDVAHHSQY